MDVCKASKQSYDRCDINPLKKNTSVTTGNLLVASFDGWWFAYFTTKEEL